jgi:hypothetical protein
MATFRLSVCTLLTDSVLWCLHLHLVSLLRQSRPRKTPRNTGRKTGSSLFQGMQINFSLRTVLMMYLKLFWAAQISGVITFALAKLSLVVLFQRIAPKRIGPRTIRWLKPMVAFYTLLSLLLIAFQCQLPHPWMLSPSNCSTHGNVYYPITVMNILTDTVLAVWIYPIIWGVQMKAHTKSVVFWLFGSRLLICMVDIGRMVVIHKALQSEDQTSKKPYTHHDMRRLSHMIFSVVSHFTDRISGSQLMWAVMDQIVVHLSINHATLPRIQTFLSHLQISSMSTHMGGARTTSKERSGTAKTTRKQLNGKKVERTSNKAWNPLSNCLTGSLNRTPSISEQPLRRPQQQQGIELSTIVCSGKGEVEQRYVEHGRSAATSLSSEGLTREGGTGWLGGVRVQREFHVVYDQI